MQTMHPTLLIGPADWSPDAMPRAEFERRIEALWQDNPGSGGAIVFGSPHDHAELSYLTHFTPKLEAGLALIPRAGAAQLLVGGGVNMIAAARPLTWIEQLKPLRNAGEAVAGFSAAHPNAVLIGGDAMAWRLRREIDTALGADAAIVDGTARLRRRMRVKSGHELAAIRDACRLLAAATRTLEERWRMGDGVTDAVIAAEHDAARAGAQDVRSLFSRDGGRTLVPFETRLAERANPLLVYLAVRHDGYWAEGFVVLEDQPSPASRTAFAALQRTRELIKPGAAFGDLARGVADMVKPFDLHPVVRNAVVPMGLALDMAADAGDTLLNGDVISLRAGAADGEGGAIASAMIAVTATGNDVLWSAA